MESEFASFFLFFVNRKVEESMLSIFDYIKTVTIKKNSFFSYR
eukprot:GSChrysophyteH1.ASY1.ANO1.502.1 assembled CDS